MQTVFLKRNDFFPKAYVYKLRVQRSNSPAIFLILSAVTPHSRKSGHVQVPKHNLLISAMLLLVYSIDLISSGFFTIWSVSFIRILNQNAFFSRWIRKIQPLVLFIPCECARSCPTLCDPMDCSPLGSSVHGIFQARILEWVAISFSRQSSWPRGWTCISCISRWILYHWATREALYLLYPS